MRHALVAHALLLVLAACEGGELAQGLEPARGDGPVVRFDLFARPLPEVPLPNDLAGRPDAGSPTGMRINASLVAHTRGEADIRAKIDGLDGWGTYSSISVGFDCPDVENAPCLDLDNIASRHQGDDFGLGNDAVYLVDIDPGSPGFGMPVPLDIGEGYFPVTLDVTSFYFRGDPRGDSRNLIFEDRDEDRNGDTVLDPEEDTNHDGRLGRANVWPPAPPGVDPHTGEWAADGHLAYWYEIATDTLIMRPILPLRPATRYAVVLTSRLVGPRGREVRSPFPSINHVDQTDDLHVLEQVLGERPGIYGGLTLAHVRFAWSFTTQTISDELRAVREGLYGRGTLARLADEFPPEVMASKMHGCNPFGPHPHDCGLPPTLYVVDAAEVADVIADVGTDIFPLPEDLDLEPTVQSYRDYVDYIGLGHFWSPYFLDHDGDGDEEGSWDIDPRTGHAPHGRERVSFMFAVPKQEFKMEGFEDRPFPVVMHTHGTGSLRLEGLGFAGQFAKFGLAYVAMDAVHHGVGQSDVMRRAIEGLFQVEDLAAAGKAVSDDRARDLNGDGSGDSGGDFWTAYIFNSRDNIRQSGADWMQLVRVMRSFDGERRAGPLDMDGDGEPEERWDMDLDGEEELLGDFDTDGAIDLAGDFNADGRVDFGGPDVPYYAWGMSLGGIVTTVFAAQEPYVECAAPVSAGAGLADVAIRSVQEGVPESVILRTIGPLVVAADAEAYIDPDHPARSDTECASGELALRFVVTDIANTIGDLEFACLPASQITAGHVLVVENQANGVRRCAPLLGLEDVRTNFPADLEDPIVVTVVTSPSGRPVTDHGSCHLAPDARVVRTIDTWESEDVEFQWFTWAVGDTLVAPAAGFGQTRSSPALRRFLGISQVGLEKGDPANAASHYLLDPFSFAEEAESRTNLLVVLTLGDMNVPINTGVSLARAAGLLNVFERDERWGSSAGRALVENLVVEGNEYRQRWIRASDGLTVLFDPSDLDRGTDGQDMPSFPSTYGQSAMSLWRPTIPGTREGCTESTDGLYLDTVTCEGGVSGFTIAAIEPTGSHSFLVSQPTRAFNINLFLANMIGYYFATGGRTWSLQTCLHDNSCYYTPVP
jgi:hypothetical protein